MKRSAKKLVKLFFILVAAPIYASFLAISLFGNDKKAFRGYSQALSLIPGTTGIYLRAAFYRLACPNTSDEISIGFLTVLSQQNTTICKGVYIGPQCNIGSCEIGTMTLIGSGVHILSGKHQHIFEDPTIPIQEQGGEYTKIKIGGDSWIGNGSIIMGELGNKTVVAAGSVVTKDFPTLCIVAGNPASIIKFRDTDRRTSRTE